MTLYDMYLSVKNEPNASEIMDKSIHLFDELLEVFKEKHPNDYKEFEDKLFITMNGYHFNESMLNDALSTMQNSNGTKAPKWNLDETDYVARQNNISLKHCNKYDWNYVLNMMYSDYCELFGESTSSYINLAIKFLDDPDAPDGKALRYYLAMKN